MKKDAIGISALEPEAIITFENNKIIIEKERNTMKALALYEISRTEEMTMDVMTLTDENKEILIRSAESNYNTMTASDKKRTLFEVRIIDIIKDEDEEQEQRLNELFERAGLKGYREHWETQEYDVIYSIGTETRY